MSSNETKEESTLKNRRNVSVEHALEVAYAKGTLKGKKQVDLY